MNNNWESTEDLGLWLILLSQFGNCETMAEFSLNLWVRGERPFVAKWVHGHLYVCPGRQASDGQGAETNCSKISITSGFAVALCLSYFLEASTPELFGFAGV